MTAYKNDQISKLRNDFVIDYEEVEEVEDN
jgi:hypothetical protein